MNEETLMVLYNVLIDDMNCYLDPEGDFTDEPMYDAYTKAIDGIDAVLKVIARNRREGKPV